LLFPYNTVAVSPPKATRYFRALVAVIPIVREGEHVRIRMVNRSPVLHPMHLHGHFFQVGDAVKDTVIVPSHMGEVTIDFLADNPGDWLFHCHNLYHLESGMARVLRYVQ
jgi:FtsP/CotA-like multicopper oxidase with cupredoxin domain